MDYDIICLGDITIDAFLTLKNSNKKIKSDDATGYLQVKQGAKIDVEKIDYCLGGNATNVAVGLCRLGLKPALFAEVGDDEFSLKILNGLAKERVDRAFIKHTRGKASSLSIALNYKNDRTLFVEHVVRDHEFSFEHANASWLFITSLGNNWKEAYKHAILTAKEKKLQIAFNPGSLQLSEGLDIVCDVLKQTTILFVNKEEAGIILKDKLPVSGNEQMQELLKKLKNLGPKIVVVTDGKNGSYGLDENDNFYCVRSVPCKIVERTGAGDSYTAAFLAAFLSGKPVDVAMNWGAQNAASVISKIGAEAGLLTKEQMDEKTHAVRPVLGYGKRLFILAFDHRNTFAEHLFNVPLQKLSHVQKAQIQEFKVMIYEAFKDAINRIIPKDDGAILVDEEYGAEVLKDANKNGYNTIVTVEKSGQKEVAFEYGSKYKEHIEKFNPTFAKVLIKYSPNDPSISRKHQQEKLRIISDYCHKNGYKFLLEILIAPTKKQLADYGSLEEFDRKIRADLTVKVVEELHTAGVEPDIWKLEGFETKRDYQKIINAIRDSDARMYVGLVVLGRGATEEKVEEWISIGSQVEGVVGFAVGRTIFWDPIVHYYTGLITKDQAIRLIAKNFELFYSVYINS